MDFFFCDEEYLNVNSNNKVEHLYLNKSSISYTIIDKIAYCPYQSTFALFKGEINSNDIDTFLKKLSTKVDKIYFSLPPINYPFAKQQFHLLLQTGFRIKVIDIVQIRSLDQRFEIGLSSSKRNKLNKLKRANFHTKQLDISSIDLCYKLIEDNRVSKNYKITISKEKLIKLIIKFPSRFIIYGTFIDKQLIACSITIKISSTILYHFIWAHDRTYDKMSPLLFHNYQIHNDAKQQGFKMIDYGTCTIDGKINRGNYRFKNELGAINSKKYQLEYVFSKTTI